MPVKTISPKNSENIPESLETIKVADQLNYSKANNARQVYILNSNLTEFYYLVQH